MYQFTTATDRIWKMREIIRDRVIRNDAERMIIITDAYQKYDGMPPIIKRPMALLELCKRISVLIEDWELIVGARGPHYFSSPQYPEWNMSDWVVEPVISGDWTLREDGLYHNPDTEVIRHTISPEDYEAIMERRDFWTKRRVGTMPDSWQPEYYEELKRLNVSSYAEGGLGLIALPAGHLIAGYDHIVQTGYKAIRDQAQTWMDEHYGNLMGEEVQKYLFYKSVVLTCDAATTLIQRYAALAAEQAAGCADPKRKAELEMMADGLMHISEYPARTFWEACQATMMYQLLIILDTRTPGPALGRFDQYTWPYLKQDLENGTLTMEQAQEIVDAFFLKANCFYSAGPAKLVDTTGIGNTYQHTTLGGVDPDTGEDATNPVTYMVLETAGRLKLHDPIISLRFNKNTPDKLWECAIETSKAVGGLPLYQNDEVIIPGLQKELGFELKDARNYGIIGCQEIVGCGNDYPAPNGIHPPHASIWWGSVVNMAINDGKNPFNGEQSGLHTGYLYEMNSIEEVREAIKKMGTYIMTMFVSTNNFAEYFAQQTAMQAPLSISIEGCMEKGKDVVQGGAKYNSYGGTATGLATVADCLNTIRYMCFETKKCTTRELYDAWINNWEGYEPLRQQILEEVPHYGNGIPEADSELAWCTNLYRSICKQFYSTRSKVYKSGLYGASDHVAQGKITFATIDGRKTGEPIADAMSPVQNRDKNGPTSVLLSTCC
ncbi:MAG: hypothetical protein LUG92_06700, partial [Oscillospiraceae bacterium]|nr:hypothetical protein [Oscillospiraceae bacterium]